MARDGTVTTQVTTQPGGVIQAGAKAVGVEIFLPLR